MNLLCLAYRCASWWCRLGTMDRNAQCVSHLINNVDCNPTLVCQISHFFPKNQNIVGVLLHQPIIIANP
jgi:hypothetical protein